MALPSDFNTGRVTGQFVDLLGINETGKVTFVARANRLVSEDTDTVVIGVPVSANLVDGGLDINLPATDDPDISPTGFTYEVTEEFRNGYVKRYEIDVPVGSTTDLSEVIEVLPEDGTTVIREGFGSVAVPELLPQAVSRMMPTPNWSQFGGFPVSATGLGELRLALAYLSSPLITGAIEALGRVPLLIGDGGTYNLSLTHLIISFNDVVTPGDAAEVKVVAYLYDLGGPPGEPFEQVLGTLELPWSEMTGPPDPDTIESFLDTVTYKTTFTLGENVMMLGLMLIPQYSATEEPIDDTPDTYTYGLVRCSMWKGPSSITPRVDPNRPSTYLGAGLQSVSGIRFGAGFSGGHWVMMASSAGLNFGHIIPVGAGLETDFSANLEVGVDDPDTPTFGYLSISHGRTTFTPVHANDLVRLQDLEAAIADAGADLPDLLIPPTLSQSIVDTEFRLDCTVQFMYANNQTVDMPNPDPGTYSIFDLVVQNFSGSNKFTDINCEGLNHWLGSSDGSGFPTNTSIRFRVLVLHGTTGAMVDMVEIGV